MADFDAGMNTTPGMWELLSEELDGVKLPGSLNAALYALRDGTATVSNDAVSVVVPRALIHDTLDALNGWRGDLHFRLGALMRNLPPNSNSMER